MYQSLDIVRNHGEANTHRSEVRARSKGLVYGRSCHILEVSVPRATAVLREKHIDAAGNIVELVVWQVAVTLHDISGIRYRLAFVRRDEEVPAVLYDNHSPKGHHRRVEGVEEAYEFVDLDRLIVDFRADVERALEKK